MNAIANPAYRIEYPEKAVPRLPGNSDVDVEQLAVLIAPSAVDAMRRCLMYRKEQRLTIPELLQHEFLRPRIDGKLRRKSSVRYRLIP
jgi:serine/threonine-protein kinase TTK/MPS1